MPRNLNLPPKIHHPQLAKAASEYRERVTDRAAASEARANAIRLHAEAENESLDNAARAARAGKPDPGTEEVERLEREIAAADRAVEIADRALASSRADLFAAHEQHRPKLRATLEAERGKREQAAQEALERFAEAHRALAEIIAEARWAETSSSWKPAATLSAVPSLRGPNGEPHHVATIVAALGDLIAPAPEVTCDQRTWPAVAA